MQWNSQPAEELTTALRGGEVTSAELTDEAIAGIERGDKLINAICVPDFDRARDVPTEDAVQVSRLKDAGAARSEQEVAVAFVGPRG
jgi:Asp-tRNA(Asn)/Glu-tRNA(Gln) amidotransferase A subunit family amidase